MITVNKDRLQKRLEEIAAIGKTSGAGVNRVALTDADRDGRLQIVQWFRDENCEIHIDPMGNIFAVYPGLDRSLAPVLTGSHSDSQPNGGRFDGILGVIAGLEVINTLRENKIQLLRDVIVTNWTNEEGTRFTPGCTGSGVWAGKLDRDTMYLLQDAEGKYLGDELERIGFKGKKAYPGDPLHAAFELHVEQGPILDKNKIAIGIPEGIVSPRWYDIDIWGEVNHAGSTPMLGRRDALYTFSIVNQIIRDIAISTKELVATVGNISVSPNSRNVIPGHVHFTLDVRGWNVEKTDKACEDIEAAIKKISVDAGCTAEIQKIWHAERADFDPNLLQLIENVANELELSSMRMYSGASHDMIYVNQVAPGAMIFVPSTDGKSHSEREHTSYADCAAGANVLLHCIMRAANENGAPAIA